MRVLHGIEAGLAALTRRPGYEEPELTPASAARTEALFGEPLTATQAVERIVADVRARGDTAIREYARRIDGADLDALEVPRHAWEDAAGSLGSGLQDALAVAAGRIRAFHEAAMPPAWDDAEAGYGLRSVAVERVGLYVPGGSAAYPSTVLMSAIPAKVAGVAEVVVCTPEPSPVTLAAALAAGVDRLFGIGGAQAIAAMAFGTGSVPQVDKICGPGNVFVSIAKRLVYGHVDIDGLYGPTETLVIADDTATPEIVAADLLAQAEHDELASPVLVTTSEAVADAVGRELERQVAVLEREPIAREALARQGTIVIVGSIEEAAAVANAFAPEHLCLLTADPQAVVALIRNAGGIFVGETSPEVMGDYAAGPSHVMPTGATARFASSLGVHTFLKHVPVVRLSSETAQEIGPAASALARAEGLTAHARAAEMRLEGAGQPSGRRRS
ncbi:MAG: histidinol dehydrogenase [Chloroflexota bacterium]|nr:histidinol dehydrogenase [Chloroflexota bacterium]MDE2883528.1 histidinol dehydrogenase [Chloroflexota bacterium]